MLTSHNSQRINAQRTTDKRRLQKLTMSTLCSDGCIVRGENSGSIVVCQQQTGQKQYVPHYYISLNPPKHFQDMAPDTKVPDRRKDRKTERRTKGQTTPKQYPSAYGGV
ncbi:hypothetical protein DPMN_165751 [Dreissena polymorpha]|uniref:Uncharacterized protein n=1 Tax=Dreissena polymorpha TaxID=45954 RepID=A0A9D4IWQ6_DREPO|nr:hypothetical protein DPMN_165751 [Dreissena polymorpha]